VDDPADDVFEARLAQLAPERWREIESALAAIDAAEGAFTEGWSSADPKFPGDSHHFPYPIYTPAVDALVRSLGAGDLTVAFDWMRWPGFTEHWPAERFRDGSAADALRLVVTAIRGERFSDGFIESLLVRGILQAAVRRLLDARPTPG
jgi:hypothetical protein